MSQKFLTLILILFGSCGCESHTNNAKTTDNVNSAHSETDKTANQETETAGITNPQSNEEQYVSFPAAGIKLIRPVGFADAEKFHGFQQESTQSSVMVVQIPGPFSKVTEGFTAEQLQSHGIKLDSKENIQIVKITALLLGVTQTVHGIEYAKWILAFGNDKETKMVTATFPKVETDKLSALLKSVVLSARPDSTKPPTPDTDVDFTIIASEKLKLTQGIGKMLVYTKDGVIPMKSPKDPLFIAAPSLSKVQTQNKQQFALQRLKNTASTNIKTVTATNEIVIDGLKGYEFIADAEDKKSGIPLIVYQVILFDDGTYILLQGMVGTKSSTEFLPEFKKMAHSFKQK